MAIGRSLGGASGRPFKSARPDHCAIIIIKACVLYLSGFSTYLNRRFP